MGETIRSLMVATLAMATLFGCPRPAAAQGFQIPQSLANAVGGATQAMANQGGGRANAGQSMPLPNFTAGGDDGLARSRSGGPTTEPVTGRDRNWMVGGEAPSRPTTDPLPRSGGSASQSPSNPQARSPARSKSGTPGFANLPDGVRLPPRTGGTRNRETFGSEFARETATGSNPSRPVYGPPTAEEANFDWSAYNNRQAGETSRPGSTDGRRSDAATMRPNAPSEYQRQAASAQAAAAQPSSNWATGSGLGLPGQAGRNTATAPNAAASRNLPTTDWTADQIATLGAQFNIPGDDPRLQDQQFVNDLYVRYREWQQRQASIGSSAATPSGERQTFDQASFGDSRGGSGDPAAFRGGGGSTAAWPSDRSGGSLDPLMAAADPRDRRNAVAGGNAPNATSPTTSRVPRRRQLYDAFGNRVDEQGNVLDERGNPVDEATAYEMTIGKKLREDMAKLAKQQADLIRETAEQSAAGSQLRVASADSAAGGRVPAGSPSDRPMSQSPAAGTAIPADDPGPGPPAGRDLESDRPKIDQAGVGGGAEAIGRSNPYVNVFLLCSLVSNAFLFVWLHRLWHHHRDLIASTRMASSGISSKD